MHDFNQFRLSSQTKAPEAIDEAILREEQRLTYAKDICEAVGLEPQELLEMLQELIELDTHATVADRHGEAAADEYTKTAERRIGRINDKGTRGQTPRQINTNTARRKAILGAIDPKNSRTQQAGFKADATIFRVASQQDRRDKREARI